jgi:PAS domain S-box-containing protein
MAFGKAMEKLSDLLQEGEKTRPYDAESVRPGTAAHQPTESRHVESDDDFRTQAAETAPVLIWISDPNGACLYVNSVWLQYTGCTMEQELGRGWTQGVHPEDAERRETVSSAAFEARARFRVEYRLRRADGEYGWVLETGAPRYTKHGDYAGYIGSCLDITDRKESEALQAALETATSRGLEGVALLDGQGAFVYTNRAYAAMYGFTSPELHGKTWRMLYDPDQVELLERQALAGLAACGHWHGELVGRTKDGRPVSIELSLQQLRTVPYSKARVACACRDITARKRADAALLTSHSLLRTLAALSPVGLYRTDHAGRCVYVNERWSEMTGLTPAEAQGDGWAQTLHHDDREQVLTQWQRAVQGGPPFRAEFRLQRADGALTWVLGQAAPEFSDTGHTIGFVGTVTDISSRKRVETMRARENRILELIAAGSPLVTILNDLIGTIEEQLPGMLGSILLADPTGRQLQHVSAPSLPEDYNRAMDGLGIGPAAGSCGAAAYYRTTVVVDDIEASPLWASRSVLALQHGLRACWSRPILSRTGRLLGTFAAYFRATRRQADADEELLDVAVHLASIAIDHAQAERALTRLNETLQARANALMDVNQELEAFSYSVSHDLAAPLRHLDGFAELLRKHAGPALDDKGRQYLTAMSAATKRMGVLIEDLLAFSRIGRTEFMTGAVSLQALVQDVLRDLHSDFHEREIRWTVHDLPDAVGDAPMLRLVFINLIGNALKYTRHRHPAIIEIGHDVRREDEVVVFVRDNGAGFDPRYAHRLFGVFQRLHTSEEFEGNGIGLANVRRIVHRHGGRTWAEGQIGAGATFWLSLPIPKRVQPGTV